MTRKNPRSEDEIRKAIDRVAGALAMEGMPLTEEDRAHLADQARGNISDEQFGQLARVVASGLPVLGRARAVLGSLSLALDWLQSPNLALNGRAPLTLLGTDEGAAQVLQVLGEDTETPSGEDALRAALLEALPENPRTAHYGAVQRARTLIVALADAAWTVILEEGKGDAAREAEQFIDRAMSSLGGRRAETQATLALIGAIAEAARARSDAHADIEDSDRQLTGFWWDWPEYANRLGTDVFRAAVFAWSAADQAGANARWKFVAEAVTAAGLPPQDVATLKRLWRRRRVGSQRPKGT